MVLAEFEVWHSRPVVPTRRVALGGSRLPVDPPPGFGGLLLAGIVAVYVDQIDEELHDDLQRLMWQIERGERIAQPRLRHRLQKDRVGLSSSVHQLVGERERLELRLEPGAPPAPQLLAAVYRAGAEPPVVRRSLFTLLRSAAQWRGGLTDDLIPYLTGRDPDGAWARSAQLDPTAWALEILEFDAAPGDLKSVQKRFRRLLRDAHPDHGGQSADAGSRIQELSEARAILMRRGA